MNNYYGQQPPPRRGGSNTNTILLLIVIILLAIVILGGAFIFWKLSTTTVAAPPVEQSQPVSASSASAPDPSVSEPSVDDPSLSGPASSDDGVYMDLWGNIGDGGDVDFEMDGRVGSYAYTRQGHRADRRELSLKSYDPSTGKCLIDAFLDGSYIGTFDGIFDETHMVSNSGAEHTYSSYHGVFRSVKGVNIDFSLHAD